ncbi:MAG: aminotransferase class I/II-fold pyridoxal phosphate-dependent enzyme [Bacteroidia bacterium]|nr:aminotransferase class I/II-fold pyridoxal phosphate-dependent enzyme [Bacteroidia bacterium]
MDRQKPRLATLKPHIQSLGTSATLAINEHMHALIRQGKEVFKLGFGQSPFPVPESVVHALQDHAHEKGYLPVRGLDTLREMVAQYYKQRMNLNADASQVIIGPGSKELIYIAILCLEGDLILPAPSWVSYAPQAQLSQKKVHWIDTSGNPQLLLTADLLEKFCQAHPKKQGTLLLNYPSNPAGSTYSSTQLQAIARIARQYGIVVISDEIYGELNHSGNHDTLARYYPEGTIISSGLSKWCGAGGWRLGTFLIPKTMHGLLDAMAIVASETYTSASSPIQYAAVKAFDFDDYIAEYVHQSRRVLKIVAQYAYDNLSDAYLTMPEPIGGFYLFPDFEFYRAVLGKRNIKTSVEFCQRLLEETGVALLPGTAFGHTHSRLTARLAYVDFDGAAALQYAIEKERELNKEDIEILVPNVKAACERIISWLL